MERQDIKEYNGTTESPETERQNPEREGAKKKRVWKKVLKVCAWLLGVWIAVLGVLQIVLSPAVLTGIVEKYANEYVDVDIDFTDIGVSMFRAFPNVELTMGGCTVTYDHNRFDSVISADMPVQRMGRGKLDTLSGAQAPDTLAVFESFNVKINPFGLLLWKLDIPSVTMSRPRIFAHTYTDGRSNYNITASDGDPTSAANSSDTTSSEGGFSLPRIAFGKVSLEKRPTIVWSDAVDTMSAFINLKRASFEGRLSSNFSVEKKIELKVDSLFAAGRMARDTVLAGIDELHIEGRDGRRLHLDLESRAYLGTKEWGRLEVPFSLCGHVAMLEDEVPSFEFTKVEGKLAYIPFKLDGKTRLMKDSLYVNAGMSFDEVEIEKLLANYGKIVSEDASKVHTDGKFSAWFAADGNYVYSTGAMPDLYGEFSLPQAKINIDGTGIYGDTDLAGDFTLDRAGYLTVNLSDICLKALGSTHLDGSLLLDDVLGKDMLIKPDLKFSSKLDDIAAILPDSLGISAEGRLTGAAKGSVRMSQLDIYKLPEANLDVDFSAYRLRVDDPADSLNIYLDSLDFCLITKRGKVDEQQKRSTRMLELTASVDTVHALYGKALEFRGKDIDLKMKNDAAVLNRKDSTTFYPMRGELEGGKIILKDGSATSFGLFGTSNLFTLTHRNGNMKVPVLSFSSRNRGAMGKSESGRVFATGVDIKASAEMKVTERQLRKERLLDSLSKVYPGVPRDSLFSTAMRKMMNPANTPEWLKEKDFLKQDIDFSLNETMKRYFRDWGLNGSLKLDKARIVTALLPLRNAVSDVDLNFNNNEINLRNICITSGESDLDASGSITGIRRAVLGRGPVKADIKLVANKLDCNELLAAYAAGQKVADESDGTSDASDSEYMEDAVAQMESEGADTTGMGLIVVPANVIADVTVEGYDISYSNMLIDWLNCNVRMKERCVQIYNTVAAANMGNLFFEGFYSTRSKTNIKTGFNLSLVDLTAGEVFDMVPQVKEIVPMLSSFDGLLSCELAGTADLDTNMNILMPTMRGVMRIGGKDLSLAQDKDLRKITKMLKFKNKGDLKINTMSVEGQISDNCLEVFPFIVDVDRYQLAMSGLQNLDMSFRYHVSVIKSPLVFRFGVDLFGQDFDHLKFKIGKAKYKNAGSIPVFTKTIDETKLNLSNSIRNVFETGVEKAIAITESEDAIKRRKEETGYVAAVDEESEPLSEEEQKELDASAEEE